MKEFILVILILATIGFCITKICEAIMYDKFLTKIIEKAEVEVIKGDKKEEKKVAKKSTTRKTKKSEKKEEK